MWELHVICHYGLTAFPFSFAPGGGNVMTKDVSGIADITKGDWTALYQVEMYRVHKVGIRWMPQHGM